MQGCPRALSRSACGDDAAAELLVRRDLCRPPGPNAEPEMTKGLRRATQPLEDSGYSTWARTRDLRINSRDLPDFAGLSGIAWDDGKSLNIKGLGDFCCSSYSRTIASVLTIFRTPVGHGSARCRCS